MASVISITGLNNVWTSANLINKVGVQLFSIPKLLSTDFEAALSLLQEIGFKEVEMYGPYSFSTELAKKYWSSVSNQLGFEGSGFFGKSSKAIAEAFKAHGLNVVSMHTDLDTLQNNMSELAAAAHEVGAKYVVLPAIPEDHRKTVDDYKKTAEAFNKIGAEANKNGIRFAYHNHGYGLQLMNGVLPLDIILNGTDPKLVFLEMDLYWTTAGGANPIELLKKHSGRYKMMHVKDMKEKVHFSGDGGDASQWIALFPYMSSAGDGILDLNNILKVAKENGMDHFFVEQDMVLHPEIALKRSYNYIKSI
jgi:sugar phosphate isomerase/epimerase